MSGDEERAFRVAWAAVKRQYRKRGNEWVPIKSQRQVPDHTGTRLSVGR